MSEVVHGKMDVSDEDWVDEEDEDDNNPSRLKKTKLSDAHPGANFCVLRAVLFAHGRKDFNRELAYWDLPSLYQVAAHDKLLGQALGGNDTALIRYQARLASTSPRIQRWSSIEQNIVAWLDARLSTKGKDQLPSRCRVCVCDLGHVGLGRELARRSRWFIGVPG